MRTRNFKYLLLTAAMLMNQPGVEAMSRKGSEVEIRESLFPKIKLRVKMYFGTNPPTCQGKFNICSIILFRMEDQPGDFEALGELSVLPDNNGIVFEIDRFNGITELTFERCLSGGTFLMTNGYQLDNLITKELRLPDGHLIMPGDHEVITNDTRITIYFR